MSRKQKLYEKLKNNPESGSFEDVCNLLIWCGFELRSTAGSHYTYKRKGYDQLVTVPRHKPLNAVYIKRAVALFEVFFDFEEV